MNLRVTFRNLCLWLVPIYLLWIALTPLYDRVLLRAAERCLHAIERPDVTDLFARGPDAWVLRRDFPPTRSQVHVFRISDIHFHILLTAALFLAVPGVAWVDRLRRLTSAVLLTVLYDLTLCTVLVEAFYATGLGPWSLRHYGLLSRNLLGLSRHLLDLPVKLALPFLLWISFYYDRIRPPAADSQTSSLGARH